MPLDGDDSDDSKVGYKKPPTRTRFKLGQSGNPKGRPKGQTNYIADLIKAFNKSAVVAENGRRKTLTKWQVACTQLANHAATGDARALRLVLKFFEMAGLWTPIIEPTSQSEPERKIDWSIFTLAELEELEPIMLKLEKVYRERHPDET